MSIYLIGTKIVHIYDIYADREFAVILATVQTTIMASEEDGTAHQQSKKLFINHVDSYQGLNLARVCWI